MNGDYGQKSCPSFRIEKGVADAEVIIDSTTMKVHRHGGGQKGGGIIGAIAKQPLSVFSFCCLVIVL
jgi:hypothetical protein